MMNRDCKVNVASTKLEQAQQAFAEVLAEASRRGFYGTTGLVLNVQDGHIQHIRISVDRLIKS